MSVTPTSTRPPPRADLAETHPSRALGHCFAVRTDDRVLARYLDDLFSPFRTDEEPLSIYKIVRHSDGYSVTHDGDHVVAAATPPRALGMLLWHVNRTTVFASAHLVRAHAAVASRHGHAILLPAPMESGKTTLVAGLVQHGFDYLSDEMAAIEPSSHDVLAYPKALSIDPGSWSVLAGLKPSLSPLVAAYQPRQWQVPAEAIRTGAIAARATPRFVAFPRYEAGTTTELTPLGRVEALERLIGCTFDFEHRPERDLPILAQVIRQSDCYDLRVGDLDTACTLLDELYANLAGRGYTWVRRSTRRPSRSTSRPADEET